jgi:hypothetical protein
MRNGTLMVMAALLALILWAGLAAFVNVKPPSAPNQIVFLIIWAMAIFSTVVPVSYALHARFAVSLGRSGNLMRVLRQGFLAAVLAIVLMALRFLYILTFFSAALLTIIVLLVELLFFLRNE